MKHPDRAPELLAHLHKIFSKAKEELSSQQHNIANLLQKEEQTSKHRVPTLQPGIRHPPWELLGGLSFLSQHHHLVQAPFALLLLRLVGHSRFQHYFDMLRVFLSQRCEPLVVARVQTCQELKTLPHFFSEEHTMEEDIDRVDDLKSCYKAASLLERQGASKDELKKFTTASQCLQLYQEFRAIHFEVTRATGHVSGPYHRGRDGSR